MQLVNIVINKEDYDGVSDIIEKLKASPDNKYIMEEGPKYSTDSEWKRSTLGELQHYNLAKEQYNKDIEIYHQKRNLISQEQEEKKIAKKKVTELANTIKKYEENLKQYDNEVNKKQGDKVILIAEDNLYKGCYIDKIFYDSEIQDIVKNLEEEYNCLNEILSVGIIYPKYNELVAWTTMYEYFATGRVTELEGTDGA